MKSNQNSKSENPRRLSERQDLACWLSIHADAIEAEKAMPSPNAQLIERSQQKWNEVAVSLANLEMNNWRKKLNKPTLKVKEKGL